MKVMQSGLLLWPFIIKSTYCSWYILKTSLKNIAKVYYQMNAYVFYVCTHAVYSYGVYCIRYLFLPTVKFGAIELVIS